MLQDSIAADVQITAAPGFVDIAPSFNQERRLLFEEALQLEGYRAPPFHVTVSFELTGHLDMTLLETAVNAIIARHASLRTGFERLMRPAAAQLQSTLDSVLVSGAFVPGQYRQVTVPHILANLEARSLDATPPDERWAGVEEIAAQEWELSFAYSQPPLLRQVLVRLQENQHVLIWTVHHLIIDRWSIPIVRRDLSDTYRSLIGAQRCALPQQETQCLDIVRKQYDQWRAGWSDHSVAYWNDRWSAYEGGQICRKDLRFALPEPPRRSFVVGVDRLSLKGSTSRTVREFAKKRGITLYMLFMAAFAVLLHRWTRKGRLAIWSNFSNRSSLGSEDVVGWLVNSHIIGVDISPNLTGRELLEQVRGSVLEASEHEDLSLSLLWCLKGRSQTWGLRIALDIFVDDMDERCVVETSASSLSIRHTRLRFRRRSSVDLQVNAFVRRDEIAFVASYAADLLGPAAVSRMLEELVNILRNLVANPGLHVSSL